MRLTYTHGDRDTSLAAAKLAIARNLCVPVVCRAAKEDRTIAPTLPPAAPAPRVKGKAVRRSGASYTPSTPTPRTQL